MRDSFIFISGDDAAGKEIGTVFWLKFTAQKEVESSYAIVWPDMMMALSGRTAVRPLWSMNLIVPGTCPIHLVARTVIGPRSSRAVSAQKKASSGFLRRVGKVRGKALVATVLDQRHGLLRVSRGTLVRWTVRA
jgi:hypothetical protein